MDVKEENIIGPHRLMNIAEVGSFIINGAFVCRKRVYNNEDNAFLLYDMNNDR